jgi:hypothetical protein
MTADALSWVMRRIVPFIALVSLALVGAQAHAADAPKKAPAAKKKAVPSKPTPFDGHYRGVLVPAPALNKGGCGLMSVPDFVIDRGKVLSTPGLTTFDGFITMEGFLSGNMIQPDATKVPIQGRATDEPDGQHIRAGLIDDKNNCAWTMELKKK